MAVDRGIKIARLIDKPEYIEDWEKLAGQIRNEIMRKGWSRKKQAFAQAYDADHLDASFLLMEGYGFIDAGWEIFFRDIPMLR